MASNASFDISTGADLQEVDNAVNQTLKEIAQRYDFKGTHCTIELRPDQGGDPACGRRRVPDGCAGRRAEDQDDQARSAGEESQGRRRRGSHRPERAPHRQSHPGNPPGRRQEASSRRSRIRRFKKIQAGIQGDEVRVTAPSRDELQEVIAFLRGQDFGIELKFGNYRG